MRIVRAILTRASIFRHLAVMIALAPAAFAQLGIVDDRLSHAVATEAYSHTLKASGGSAPYLFTITGGALPRGLTLSTAGLLSGTPEHPGNANFTVRVIDGFSAIATRNYALRVVPKPAPQDWKPRAVFGGNITQMAISTNYATDQTAFVRGDRMELFRSTDGGANWNRTTVDDTQASAASSDLELSPAYNQSGANGSAAKTVFFTSGRLGVFRSTDGGQSFTAANSGLPNGGQASFNGAKFIECSPGYGTDQTAFLAWGTSPLGLYRTTNGGANWGLHASLSFYPDLFEIAPTYPGEPLLFMAAANQLYRTTDGGANWSPGYLIPGGYQVIQEFHFSPNFASDRTIMFMTSDLDLYRSTDGGVSFSLLSPFGGSGYTARSLTVASIGGTVHWFFSRASGTGKYSLMVSTNGGASFAALFSTGRGNPTTNTHRIMAAARGGAGQFTVFHGYDYGLDISNDDGYSFEPANRGMMLAQARTLAGSGDLVVAGLNSGRWLKSEDAGANWTVMGNLAMSGNYSAVSPSYATDRTIFFGGTNGTYRSTDGGQTFSGVSGAYVRQYALAPGFNATTGTMFIASDSGLLRSTNGGQSFTALTLPPACANSPYFSGVAVSPSFASDQTVFANASNLCKSVDGGSNWSVINGGVALGGLVYLPPTYLNSGADGTAQKIVFVIYGSGLRRSTNGGNSFSVTVGLPVNALGTLTISPLFALDGTVFFASGDFYNTPASNGIFRSSDYGSTYARLGAGDGVQTRAATAIYLPASFDGRLSANSNAVAATDGSGIYRATDGGRAFSLVTQFNTTQRVLQSVDMTATGTVFAATGSLGVFKSTDGGVTFSPQSAGLPADSDTRAVKVPAGATTRPLTAVNGKGLWRFDGVSSWSSVTGGLGQYEDFAEGGGYLFAARKDGTSLRSTDNGGSWSAMGAGVGDMNNIDYNPESTASLVANGGFESPSIGLASMTTYSFPANFGGWSVESGSVDLAATAWVPAGGLQSLDMSGLGAGAIYQDVPTRAGQQYRISFAIGGVGSCGAAMKSLELWWAGARAATLDFDATGKTAANPGWEAREYAVSASGSITRLRFLSLENSTCGLLLDNVRIVQVEGFGMTPLTYLKDSPAGKLAAAAAGEAATPQNTAPLWGVSQAGGPHYSADNGTTWVSAPGGGDYQIPAGATWSVVRALGIDPATGGRIVLAGTAKQGASTPGLFRSNDGGLTWRQVAGAGSGLEATSKDFAAIMATPTAFGTEDLLIGAKGSTTGGVYLSGDNGEHWTQVNQGYDPAQLSISTLVKTSCNGCPVQYYSGSYGGGLYTRTLAVTAPPVVQSWNFGNSAGPCAQGASGGPVSGGQAFRICGANFQVGAIVEFDGVAATGCVRVDAATLTCTGTPAHVNGPVKVRVRNPDTRVGALPPAYLYAGGASRIANSLRAAKAGQDGNLTWSCAGCTVSSPAIVYRSQNAAFTLHVQNFVGGTDNAHLDPGAVGGAKSYFWSVE